MHTNYPLPLKKQEFSPIGTSEKQYNYSIRSSITPRDLQLSYNGLTHNPHNHDDWRGADVAVHSLVHVVDFYSNAYSFVHTPLQPLYPHIFPVFSYAFQLFSFSCSSGLLPVLPLLCLRDDVLSESGTRICSGQLIASLLTDILACYEYSDNFLLFRAYI